MPHRWSHRPSVGCMLPCTRVLGSPDSMGGIIEPLAVCYPRVPSILGPPPPPSPARLYPTAVGGPACGHHPGASGSSGDQEWLAQHLGRVPVAGLVVLPRAAHSGCSHSEEGLVLLEHAARCVHMAGCGEGPLGRTVLGLTLWLGAGRIGCHRHVEAGLRAPSTASSGGHGCRGGPFTIRRGCSTAPGPLPVPGGWVLGCRCLPADPTSGSRQGGG